MPIVCWGNLAKSADDNQRIEQAMEDYVSGHNQDVNAHQIPGSSLYMHREQVVIDHQDFSITIPKITADKRIVLTAFDSFDGWEMNASASYCQLFGSRISTSAVANNEAQLYAEPSGAVANCDWSKNMMFQETIELPSVADQLLYIVTGLVTPDAGDQYFGFRIDGQYLNAENCYGDGEDRNVTSTNIATLLSGTNYTLCASYDIDNAQILFYLNGVLLATHTTNLPQDDSTVLFTHYIKTKTTAIKSLIIKSLLWQGDN